MEIEDEFHFVIICSHLSIYRMSLFNEISSIVPSFKNMNSQCKFNYIFTCNEYDICQVIINGISIMYNKRCELAKQS